MTSPFLTANVFLINFAVMLLTTSFIGSIMTILWLGIGKMLERVGFVNIVLELLKLAVLFYFFPLVYLLLKLFETELGNGYLFFPTEAILDVIKGFFFFWFTGVLLVWGYMLHDSRILKKRFCDAFSCSKEMQLMFDATLEEMGIKTEKGRNSLQLRQSYRTRVPCVIGIFNPMVIIPVDDYSIEELQFIFAHEITHYKQKDVMLKRVAALLCGIHFYNPLMWLLLKQIIKWSEYACDYKVCSHTGNVKKYFKVLMRISTEDTIRSRLASHLVENRNELVGRAKKMKRVLGKKACPTWSVVVILMMAFLGSSMTVGATTLKTASLYCEWKKETILETELDEESDRQEIITEQRNLEGLEVVFGEVQQFSRAINMVDWNVNNNTVVYGSYYNCEEGDEISVLLEIVPTDVSIKVGIENESGTRVYVKSKELVDYAFVISQNGKYRVFVENTSGQSVTVEGSYRVP